MLQPLGERDQLLAARCAATFNRRTAGDVVIEPVHVLRRHVAAVLLEVSGHFKHGALNVRAVQIERRRTHEHRAAAEILDVEARVGKYLQV